ncbi:helix-turn-helix transcriptional regulator [Sphaerisporangium siamense]|uniref:Transcriptional regulator with XRE-family HTH domain n=1 Tax=Sphaerisporangium siamense TaxID=795645 RepID=A0A7W7D323_9ACTN|nr:helix-turn-helix transcriptional regulator [Sphaerisporangium siamense]MBB4699328.1 transcriptional regulator with XRE-family HTH domain [Sphaerisporangium siamense]
MSRNVSESVTEPNPFWSWLHTHAGGLGYRSEARLARALDVSPTTVMRWKRGAKPSIDQLLKIGEVLGVKLEPLLVLSGLVPAEALGNPDMPVSPSPVTPGERLIIGSGLDQHLQDLLQKYWKSRLSEERSRVEKLIDMMKSDIRLAMLDNTAASQMLSKLPQSDLQEHLTEVILQWIVYQHVNAAAADKPRRRRRPPTIEDVEAVNAQIRDAAAITKTEDGKFVFELGGSTVGANVRSNSFDTKEEAEAFRDAFLDAFKVRPLVDS